MTAGLKGWRVELVTVNADAWAVRYVMAPAAAAAVRAYRERTMVGRGENKRRPKMRAVAHAPVRLFVRGPENGTMSRKF